MQALDFVTRCMSSRPFDKLRVNSGENLKAPSLEGAFLNAGKFKMRSGYPAEPMVPYQTHQLEQTPKRLYPNVCQDRR